jgi:hypothetical protein
MIYSPPFCREVAIFGSKLDLRVLTFVNEKPSAVLGIM